MQIGTIEIRGFRSIYKCKINIKKINAIVGENNAGKTAILRGMNSFFNFENESPYFISKSHQHISRKNTKIIVTFDDIPNKEIYNSKLANGKLVVAMEYSYSTNKRVIKVNDKPSDESFINELKKDIDFVYIPVARNDEEFSWGEKTVFSKLITSYASKYTQKRDNFSKDIRDVSNKLHNTILKKIEKQLSELYMQSKAIKFLINFNENIDYSILLDKLSVKIEDEGMEYLLDDFGSGIKSLTVIALYRALAQISESNIILGIEEPEINLHPQAQKKFIYSLKNKLQSNETQIIFSTHSTVLVDALEHNEIILAKRVTDSKRGFKTEITQISDDFWLKHGIDDFKHYRFFKYRNSDMFFAKYVVIVESSTDTQVVERLIKDGLKDKFYDVSILNLEGVQYLRYPYFLLKDLKIPFSIIVDKDFFFEYKNNQLDSSRDKNGYPKYANKLKEDKVISDIFNSESERQNLLKKLLTSEKEGYKFLKNYKIYSMKYCLEMDLVNSKKTREKYFEVLGIVDKENQNERQLLVQRKNQIKDVKNIMEVMKGLNTKDLPQSYQRIKREILEDINSVIK